MEVVLVASFNADSITHTTAWTDDAFINLED